MLNESTKKSSGSGLSNTTSGAGVGERIEHPRNVSEFEALLRRGRDFLVLFSAQLAEAVLAAWNTGNRRIDRVKVEAYKRDMAAGKWLRGEVLGFGVFHDSIQMGDGQHRVLGQVASATDQIYSIRIITEEDEFALFVTTRDSQKPRTLADMCTIMHITEGSGAAMLFERICNAMQTFTGATPSRLTRQERLSFAQKHAKEIRYALGLPSRKFKAHTLAAVAIAYGKQPKLVTEFIGQVISGADLRAGSPALELSNALPDLSDAKGPKEKDRAMAVVMRVIHDGISGRKKTTVNSVLRTSSSPIVTAIADFAGASVARAWVERNSRTK